MASSRPREDLDAVSNKINKALSLFDDCKPGASTKNDGESELLTFSEMATLHWQPLSILGTRTLFQDLTEFISSKFPFHDLIDKSNLLSDEKLYEAILFSKVFYSVDRFHAERRKYEGELVWVAEDPHKASLICHQQIIYTISRRSLQKIRESVQSVWEILKKKVGKNLIQAFSWPEGTQSWSDAPSISVACESVMDEVKKAMLDEVNSFNLDPRIKDQFELDLKMLPDRDMHYWHGRLDTLRLCSMVAVQRSQKPSEVKQLPKIIANPGKVIGCNEACVASLAEQIKSNETVEKSAYHQKAEELKEYLEQILDTANVLLGKKFSDVIREDFIFEKLCEDDADEIDDLKIHVVEKLERLIDAIDPDKCIGD